MCGDYWYSDWLLMVVEGSPPHVRGLRQNRFFRRPKPGITPACAGTTSTPVTWATWEEDHPRMCGDYPRRVKAARENPGSPPHVRGLLWHYAF